MSILPRLDPELAAVVSNLPVRDLNDIPAAREQMAKLLAMINLAEPSPDVQHSDHLARGAHGDPDVLLRAFRPRVESGGPLPCLYWIQGGGYVLTAPDLDDRFCETIVETHRCAVVSINWRRAPEHPFPAAANDVYAGLAWTIGEADRLGIDSDRLVVGGHSSGGGKAAALALMVRDRGELSVAHQLLLYPMLDDRQTTPSSARVTDPQVWNRESNELAWRAYLGEMYGSDDVSPYAAPARATDLSALPPATMLTGELDLFVDEDIIYAQRLMSAGVPIELHVYPAAHHGFDRHVPRAVVARRFVSDRDAALRRAFAIPAGLGAGGAG
jgi:acetyl esterase/lipase